MTKQQGRPRKHPQRFWTVWVNPKEFSPLESATVYLYPQKKRGFIKAHLEESYIL